ncbi:MAG: hypothetical protein Q8S33_37680 [Myxococcales bacterium]|nr:hypothetical protein [Myxococcales bacterium]
MSDLDERLARWKAQTATLQTPPELKARLKQTSGTVAKAGVSAAVKAGVLIVLAVAVAVGLRFWPLAPRPDIVNPVVAPPAPTLVASPPPAVVAPPSAIVPAIVVPGAVPSEAATPPRLIPSEAVPSRR